MYYTYVLECTDNETKNKIFYVGSSEELDKRILAHKSKTTQTTRRFDSIKLVYYEACLNKTDAIRREHQLKTGFGRGYIKKRIEEYLTRG